MPSRRIIYLLQCIVVSWWPGVMAHDNLRGGRWLIGEEGWENMGAEKWESGGGRGAHKRGR